MTSKVRASGLIATAGALAVLALFWGAPAQARKHHHHASGSGAKTDSAAYPNSPNGTPAAGDNGKPVTPKPDAAAKPGPGGSAGSEGAKASTGTPATAYPGAPTDQPSAGAKP
jgi:hypothetical protein